MKMEMLDICLWAVPLELLGGNLSAISNNPASGAVFELSRFGGSLIANSNSN